MSALTGSAVDIGRLYLVKVRLQQACDAGALAGRKFMADSNSSTLDAVATTQVPMTVMKMFGQPTRSITVTCEARYDIADTDVMFVLDTTGSMVCAPAETGGCTMTSVSYTRPDGTTGYSYAEKPTSKIVASRSAVMDFYDTVAANADPSGHVRYGVVTYTSTVNAGAAVPSQYLLNTDWTYRTRRAIGDRNWGNVTTTTYTSVSSATCNGYTGRTPALYTNKYGATAYTYAADGTAVWKSVGSWPPYWWNTSIGSCVINNQPVVALWRHAQWPADIPGYVASLSTDLDPDLIPNSDDTRW